MRHHTWRVAAAAALSVAGLAALPALLPAAASTVVGTNTPVTVDAALRQGQRRAPRRPRRHHGLRRQPPPAERALHRGRPAQPERSSSPAPTTTARSSCAGGTWAGFYRSTEPRRAPGPNSLLPGYPTDTSPEGLASPLQQRGITNAGDPVQAWDLQGRLFYMGNAFNRVAPQNGSVWVATYDQDAAHYVRTVIVGKRTARPSTAGSTTRPPSRSTAA